MNIAIIGAGEIGSAVHASIRPEHRVDVWDKMPGKVQGQRELSEFVPAADVIFFCVPSPHVRDALDLVKPLWGVNATIVSVTKGIESGAFVHEIFTAASSHDRFVLLSGPMLAEELEQGHGAVAVAATQNPELVGTLTAAFKQDWIRLELCTDTSSVALAGVLKNIYSVLLGIAEGLGYENNVRGWLVSQVVPEAEKIFKKLSLDSSVMRGTAGLGDMVATSFSVNSLNRAAGMAISSGTVPPKSEGMVSLQPLMTMLGPQPNGELIYLDALNQILFQGANPHDTLVRLVYAQSPATGTVKP